MASEVAELEKLFKTEILSVTPEIPDAVGARLYNCVAPAGATLPYAVFQVIPLNDNFGQARSSIQSVFFVDFKVICAIPFSEAVDTAIAAVKEHFRASATFTTDNFRVSVRHERPINLPTKGATPDEKLLMRGSTYKAWMSGI